MDLPGYDAWRTATPPEYERDGRIESLIERDEGLSKLQLRAELQEHRAAALTKKLAATEPGPYRDRIAKTLQWAQVVARCLASELENAIEDVGEDGPEYDPAED